jgi:hypothetical protein
MFDPEALVPLAGMCLVFGIPIVAILTSHQQKMAKLINERGSGMDEAAQRRISRLEAEVESLRDRLNQAMIDRESIRPTLSQTPPAAPEDAFSRREESLNG